MDPNISSSPVQPETPIAQAPVTQSPVTQAIPGNQGQPPVTTANIPSRPTYRLSAVLIDNSIILGLWTIVCLLMAVIFNIHILIKDANNNPLVAVYSLVGAIISIAYFSYFHAHAGATPGKKIYGLRVIDINTSSKLTYSKSLLRELIKSGIGIIPLFGGILNLVNGLLVIFTKTKQGMHDSVIKSQVIEVGKPLSLWKQLVLFVFLILFWAVSSLILIFFVFSIGAK